MYSNLQTLVPLLSHSALHSTSVQLTSNLPNVLFFQCFSSLPFFVLTCFSRLALCVAPNIPSLFVVAIALPRHLCVTPNIPRLFVVAVALRRHLSRNLQVLHKFYDRRHSRTNNRFLYQNPCFKRNTRRTLPDIKLSTSVKHTHL